MMPYNLNQLSILQDRDELPDYGPNADGREDGMGDEMEDEMEDEGSGDDLIGDDMAKYDSFVFGQMKKKLLFPAL